MNAVNRFRIRSLQLFFFTNLINFQHFSSLLAGCTHLTSYAVVQFGAVVFDVRNKLLKKKDAYN